MLSLERPHYGWSKLKVDNHPFLVSYTTNFGYDFLTAVCQNYTSDLKVPRTVLFDTEEDGYYYIIIDQKEITICSVSCPWAAHYYFDSPKDLLDQVMESMYPFAQEWITFYNPSGDEAMINLFRKIKEEVYGQVV